MTEEELVELVEQLTKESAWRPEPFRRRVVLLTVLGYTYFFGLLLISLAVLGVLVWLMVSAGRWYAGMGKILIPILIAVGAMLRSLWVTWPPPAGRLLKRRQAPALFEILDRIRKNVRAPKLHYVLLNGELNASVNQHPRLGLFGWYVNYVILGLPMLLALPRQELEAVLAHELGHLAGGHGRIRSWIHRSWVTWGRLREALQEKESWANFLVKPFVRYFFPRYSAHAMVLSRADEYEVDSIAAEVAGNRVAADALVRLRLADEVLEEHFWPEIIKSARTSSDPPKDVYQRMAHHFMQPLPEIDARLRLEDVLAEEGYLDDTHPSLSQRLEALDQEPRRPPPVARAAVFELFEDAAEPLMAELGEAWVQSVAEVWQEQREQLIAMQQERDRLASKKQEGTANRDQEIEHAELTWQLDGSAAALPYYSALYNSDRQDPNVALSLGQLLLEEEHAQAPTLLAWAIRLDRSTTLDACSSLIRYYRRSGDDEQCRRWSQRAFSYQQMLGLAEAERKTIWADDELFTHGLAPEELKKVQQVILKELQIRRAYLVQKRVLLLTDQPCFILGLLCTEDAEGALIDRLRESLAYLGRLLIVMPERDDQRRRFAAVPGALVVNR